MTEKLTAGIHADVPMSTYLGDLCPGPSISGSGLALIDRKTPAHWYATSYLNPNRADEEDTVATSFGTAAHVYILEGVEAFDRQYIVKPADLNLSTKEGKAWKAANVDGREIVSADGFARIKRMAAAIAAKPKVARLLAGTLREATVVWQDKETGVWLKARPDALSPSLACAINLKTCEDAEPDSLRKQVDRYDYYVSAALCLDGLRAVGWHDAPTYAFVFAEKKPPHEPRIGVLDPVAIEWGRLRARRAIRLFADCLASGRWPGFDDEPIEVSLPPWAERSLERRHEQGEFTQQENAA